MSALYLRNKLRLSHHSKWSEKEKSLWDHFVGDDYRVECYWFRHLYWVCLFSIVAILEFSVLGWLRCVMITATLLAYLALLYWFRPFADDDRWKLYVRTALVICSILIAVLDLIKFVEVEGMADEDEELSEAQSSNHSSQPFSAIFAYIVFASCMAAIAVLFTAFFLAQYGHGYWMVQWGLVISNCSASAKEDRGGASRSESSQGRDLVARATVHRSQADS